MPTNEFLSESLLTFVPLIRMFFNVVFLPPHKCIITELEHIVDGLHAEKHGVRVRKYGQGWYTCDSNPSFDFFSIFVEFAVLSIRKRQVEPVLIKSLEVAIKGFLAAVFTDPDNLKDVVMRDVDFLRIKAVESLVEEAAGRRPISTKVESYNCLAFKDIK